jgi:hypothetical protein
MVLIRQTADKCTALERHNRNQWVLMIKNIHATSRKCPLFDPCAEQRKHIINVKISIGLQLLHVDAVWFQILGANGKWGSPCTALGMCPRGEAPSTSGGSGV